MTLTPVVRQSSADRQPAAAPVLMWQPIKGVYCTNSDALCEPPPIVDRRAQHLVCSSFGFGAFSCIGPCSKTLGSQKGVCAAGDAVPWHTTVVRVDVLCYARRGSSTAEAASLLQSALRTQLQARLTDGACAVQTCMCHRCQIGESTGQPLAAGSASNLTACRKRVRDTCHPLRSQVVRAALDQGRNFLNAVGEAAPPQRALHFQPPGELLAGRPGAAVPLLCRMCPVWGLTTSTGPFVVVVLDRQVWHCLSP